MVQRPVVIGLFLCNELIVDEDTRDLTLVNCFSRRIVRHDPPEPITFTVFALLTDGMGDVPLEVRIERLDTLEDIFRIETSGVFESPLHEVRVRLRLRSFSFPALGEYCVSLLADGETIAQRKLQIRQEEQE
jgi:hypothetical protein